MRRQLRTWQKLQVQKLGRKWCDGKAEERRLERLNGPGWEGPWRQAQDRTLHERWPGA